MVLAIGWDWKPAGGHLFVSASGRVLIKRSWVGCYEGTIPPEDLEAFRKAMVRASLCTWKPQGGGPGVVDVDSKLPGVSCDTRVTPERAAWIPRYDAIRRALWDLRKAACRDRCADFDGTQPTGP